MNKDGSSARRRLLVRAGCLMLLLGVWWWFWTHRWSFASDHARGSYISHNLRILEGAKMQWEMEHHQITGALPTPADLTPYLRKGEFPKAIAEETYVLNPVGEYVEARLSQRVGQWDAGQALTVTSF